jgi:hypothetical protein
VLRSNERIAEAIDYVRFNPVRHGLVRQPAEYRWIWTE